MEQQGCRGHGLAFPQGWKLVAGLQHSQAVSDKRKFFLGGGEKLKVFFSLGYSYSCWDLAPAL